MHIDQVHLSLRALYLENKVPSRLYLGYHWRDIPKTWDLVPVTHALRTVWVL